MSFNLNSYLDREPVKTFLKMANGVINYIRILNIQVEIPGEPAGQTEPPTPPDEGALLISGYTLDPLNRYVDVSFDPDVFAAEGGALQSSDLQIVFSANGGTATGASISSITTTAGGALSGGENTIRVNLTITGDCDGSETIEIKAAGASVYKDGSDNLNSASDTTGAITLDPTYDSLYEAGISYFLSNSITPPTRAQRVIDNTLFTSARSAGWLTELPFLYLFTSSAACSRFEYISGTYIGTYTGTVTVTTYLGARASTNGYFNTAWNPLNNGGTKYVQNSASQIVVIGNNAQSGSGGFGSRGTGGTANTGATRINGRNTSNEISGVINANISTFSNTATSQTDSEGVHHLSRNASNDSKYYFNGTQISTSTQASSALSSQDWYAFAVNLNGTPSLSNEAHDLMLFASGSDLRSSVSSISTLLNTWKTDTKNLYGLYTGRLYKWIGQSNMDRADELANLTAGQAALYNNGPISIANGYDANCYVWWNDEWQLLEAGVNGVNFGSGGEIPYFGPIYPFAVAESAKYPGEDLFFVMNAVPGTNLELNWSSPGGNQWINFKTKYEQAISQLIVTTHMPVYWGQGEADSQVLSYANNYETNEDDFMIAFFTAYNTIDAIVMQINDNASYAYKSTVRTAKSNNLTNGNYGVSGALINIDDLPLLDGAHLNNTNSITFAERLSAAYP
jgi:hypothetical protein